MIEIVKGDITTLEFDCIVNAANSGLRRGSGVCWAIFRAVGEGLQEYLWDNYDGCPTGEVWISPGFACLVKHIIHTVAPIWMGGTQNEPILFFSNDATPIGVCFYLLDFSKSNFSEDFV